MTASVEATVALYLLVANALAVGAFLLDKRRAEQGGQRIPERTLLGLAFWSGSIGALCAQQLFRHKTRKQPFRAWLILIAVFHIVLALVLLIPSWRDFAGAMLNYLLIHSARG